MTTKVVDFLNESGGTNFTETAPRPPTYGEENELQSNGGNSTKSSNSLKSHGSNKSHCSTKSGTSIKGDHIHSPATTPRKSNLDSNKTSDAMTGIANTTLGDCEDNEAAAPLGFEPEGSTANSPPYSENGTLPHLKWAENLTYLLEDSEGVLLFRDFMEHELPGGSEELQFWFACQGFKKRKISSSADFDHALTDIQKAIYKRYVRSDKVKCISKAVKKEIADKISNKNIAEPGIFDAAQEEVEISMRNETYPAFLLSHYYLEYVQNNMDSPKSSPSSGSNSARPVSQSGLLPVVHEDKELESVDLNFSIPLPPATKAPPAARKSETMSMKHAETLNGSAFYSSRRQYYPSHISYAPVSAQDSELQSLSSDALTDDTLSVTDSNADSYSHRLISNKKHHRKAVWKFLASHNREQRTGLHSQIIPRTERAPKDRNLAEVEPNQFAGILIDKLNRLVEEIETTAKVEEKLLSITTNEADKADNGEKLLTTLVKANTSASFIPLPSAIEEETAESILDQHCSRIWESSSHHTPSYSPPRPRSPPHRSPNRHKDSRKKGAALPAYVAASGRERQKKRELVSYDIEDRSLVVGTETHRHIHHHHHHHHSSRDSSFKKAHVDLDSQTSGVAPWRTDNPQNISSDFSSMDYANRGRTYTCKNSANMLRKTIEVSSNIDSGISMMDSVKTPLNLSHPTSEKVIKWMMNSEIVQEVSLAVQDPDKSSSSHKRLHRLNQSASLSQQTRTSSKSRNSAQSTSVERSSGVLAPWSGVTLMPSQPIVQDPSMPPLTPPHPTTQLEEAKRRLEQTRATGVAASSPFKSKGSTGAPPKDKTRLPSGGLPLSATSHNRTLPSARTVPTHLDASAVNQSFDSRVGQHVPGSSTSLQPNSSDTIIGIYMGQEPIPYRHQLPGRAITLAQIKTLVTKRGPFKFYFKRHSDEFGDSAGAVFEEICDDSTIVPMWQGKIVVKVEKLDL